MKNGWKLALGGLAAGVCNGIFGSGGGMIAVPLLQKAGLSAHKAHSTALAVILPLTVVSIFRYASFGTVKMSVLVTICAGGVVGGILGAKLLKRFSGKWLSRIFGVFMIIAAVRMVMS